MKYSKTHIILDAVQFAIDADTNSFGQLVAQNVRVLQREVALRILLTYLPESTPPSQYTELLLDLYSETRPTESSSQLPQPSKDLSEDEATARVRALKLLPLVAHTVVADHLDELERFVISRARKVDAELGSITFLQPLLEPFVQRSQALKGWTVAVLLPLVRLNYEFYPHHGQAQRLDTFEQLQGTTGVETLLARAIESKSNQYEHYGRDLRCIVGPWMFGEACRKYHKLGLDGSKGLSIEDDVARLPQIGHVLASCWGEVYEWLLKLAESDFTLAEHFFEHWDGPSNVDYEGLVDGNFGGSALALAERNYVQTGLAMIYQCQELGTTAQATVQAILAKAAKISGLLSPPSLSNFDQSTFTSSLTHDYLSAVSTVHLLPAELLEPLNPLTKPSSDSLELTFLVLKSTQLMDSLGQTWTINRVLRLALFGSQIDQWDAFRRVLHSVGMKKAANDDLWTEAREELLWLRSWQASSRPAQARHGVFAQIGQEEFENEILKALVTNNRYKAASRVYCDSKVMPLPRTKVEKSILEVVMASYDNASNGNRTRGGMKKANEVVNTFSSHFPNSDGFRQASALILATHRLSFYSLTLQHGVPFLPVNVRIHPDPLSLIDRVLEQNQGSYTKLDDLLDIGQNLVKAGLIISNGSNDPLNVGSEDLKIGQVERRIIAKAIETSLAEDDFDTAYSYIVTRLSTSQQQTFEPTDTQPSVDEYQEVLWKAAYQAGRYPPKNQRGPSELRRLEQRMELLSQALLLAPASSLQEVLTIWRACEKELNAALAKETEEEKAWNDKSERTVPGGFSREDITPSIQKPRETTRKAMNEEAPMSLFDVTRNAAAALSKSAFPLRGQRQGIATGESGLEVSDQYPSPVTSEGDGRVRKRDMVSNMVTGGLASGIGWVIGKF